MVLNETTAYRKKGRTWQSKCRTCFNTYCVERWKKKKLDAITYKGGKCEKCGYNKYYGALEFHHLDPTQKDIDWGKMRLRNWIAIKEELDKCVCLCSRCHREAHQASVV